jgi:hypothetical protein
MRKFYALLSFPLAAIAVLGVSCNWGRCEDAAVSATLTRLEDRLLEHDYHTESDDLRLSRLEKFVFGEAETGTIKERVARLNAAIVPAKEGENFEAAPIPARKNVASLPPFKQAAKQSASSNSSASANSSHYDPSDFGKYPRVAELEQQLFGKTFVSDPLPVRISRLETKEFGHASSEDDLCDRMDKLDRLLAPSNAITASSSPAPASTPHSYSSNSSSPGYGGSYSGGDDEPPKPAVENPFAPGAAEVKSIEQRTSILEKFVFGHEHFGKPLAERVARLEKKLVPYEHHTDKDLPTRVDHLWTMLSAANTANRSPLASE